MGAGTNPPRRSRAAGEPRVGPSRRVQGIATPQRGGNSRAHENAGAGLCSAAAKLAALQPDLPYHVSGLSPLVAPRPTPTAGAAEVPPALVTVNKVGLKVVPRGALTPMAPVTPLAGTTMPIWLSEITVKSMGVAAPVGKVTWVVPVNPVPLMVTLVPGGPDAGEVPLIATTGVSGFNCSR